MPEEIRAPSDGNCMFWFTAMAYLHATKIISQR